MVWKTSDFVVLVAMATTNRYLPYYAWPLTACSGEGF